MDWEWLDFMETLLNITEADNTFYDESVGEYVTRKEEISSLPIKDTFLKCYRNKKFDMYMKDQGFDNKEKAAKAFEKIGIEFYEPKSSALSSVSVHYEALQQFHNTFTLFCNIYKAEQTIKESVQLIEDTIKNIPPKAFSSDHELGMEFIPPKNEQEFTHLFDSGRFSKRYLNLKEGPFWTIYGDIFDEGKAYISAPAHLNGHLGILIEGSPEEVQNQIKEFVKKMPTDELQTYTRSTCSE